MAEPTHIELLRGTARNLDAWRDSHPGVRLDLNGADLRGYDLAHFNLEMAMLNRADLSGSNLLCAKLERASLNRADLSRAVLLGVNAVHGCLDQAGCVRTDFLGADLQFASFDGADLSRSNLGGARFHGGRFGKTDFTGAHLVGTVLADVDLSEAVGLDSVRHAGPSIVGVDTLMRCGTKLPLSFLRGCGVPDSLIEYLPSLVGSMQPIQFYSCFLSHSSKDHAFATRLHARLQQEGLRVWFAPEDMKGGLKSYDQIDTAIRSYDKLLLVVSESSMASTWVKTEVRRARQRELTEKRQVLFPIRICSMKAVKVWTAFDSDLGRDLAADVREYHIPDFSKWKDQDSFEEGFADLLRDLRKSADTAIVKP